MTIQDTTRVIYLIHTAYPSDRKTTDKELADRVTLWSVFFRDYEAETVERAVKAWIVSQSFMPTPKEIKEACGTLGKLGYKLAGAHYIPDEITETDPETEARLAALWDSIQETAREADS